MNTISILFLMFAPSAQTTGTQAQPGWISFVPMAVIAVLFYVILIRPQMKKQREQEGMLKKVKTGDKVIAAGGIVGIITNVKEQTVMLKVADGVKIEVQKSSIATVLNANEPVEVTTVS
jgi:preprotein translocase subunit YajC